MSKLPYANGCFDVVASSLYAARNNSIRNGSVSAGWSNKCEMQSSTTVYGHIGATRVRVYGPGGEEPMSLGDRRICALVFDGQPLGHHQLPHDKEGNKRINEMIGIAGALVGATVDREIRCLRSLPARHDVATTDFEADLRDGRTLRLETCALVDVTQQRYVNATRTIMQRVNAAIGAIPAVSSAGKYFVRGYGRPLEATDIGPVSIELTEFLTKSGPTLPLTRSMTKIGAPYTILERLNTHVCRLNDGGRTGVVLEPLMHLLGNARPRDVFPTLFAQKGAKYNEYSDGGADSEGLEKPRFERAVCMPDHGVPTRHIPIPHSS